MTDLVNHPPHYKAHPSGIECIEVTRHMGFNLGNAVKYIWRADEKGNAIQDLEKAAWYINDEIEKRQRESGTPGVHHWSMECGCTFERRRGQMMPVLVCPVHQNPVS